MKQEVKFLNTNIILSILLVRKTTTLLIFHKLINRKQL